MTSQDNPTVTVVRVKSRRPIWRPSRLSRMVGLLKSFRKHLTLKRTVLAAILLPLVFYIYREVTREALIIDPFSVPKQLDEVGLTPDVVAGRIGDALRQIEADTQTFMKKDNLASFHDEGVAPDVEIPGTKMGLKTIVEMTRAVFGVYPKHIGGDIVVYTDATRPPVKPQLKVTVYITQGRTRSRASSAMLNADDIDVLALNTAEMILDQVNPYVLAKYQYDHGDADSAVRLLRRIVGDASQERSHIAAALSFWGIILGDQGKYDEAVAKYQEAIDNDARFALAYDNWGILLRGQHKYNEAIAKYQRAIDIDPRFELAYNDWGDTLRDQQKYDEAVAKYQRILKINPQNADAYYSWGVALQDQRRYEEAITEYEKALKIDPEFAFAYVGWGSALQSEHKYDGAIGIYQKAIETDPRCAAAYYNWGKALVDQGKYDEAIPKYQKAAEIDPKLAVAFSK